MKPQNVIFIIYGIITQHTGVIHGEPAHLHSYWLWPTLPLCESHSGVFTRGWVGPTSTLDLHLSRLHLDQQTNPRGILNSRHQYFFTCSDSYSITIIMPQPGNGTKSPVRFLHATNPSHAANVSSASNTSQIHLTRSSACQVYHWSSSRATSKKFW